jgi:hypothetical protein
LTLDWLALSRGPLNRAHLSIDRYITMLNSAE